MNDMDTLNDSRWIWDNERITDVETMITPQKLIDQVPLDDSTKSFIRTSRTAISEIIHMQDDRLLVITWPCSIHNPDEALEIAKEIKELQNQNPHLYIVMRTYFEKPRSTVGWKWLLNDPDLDESCDIEKWLSIWRELLLKINQMGVPTAVEFLDMQTPQYIADLVHWGAIWARTTESQEHRKMSSGLSMPIGFKNGTNWSVSIATDAIESATNPHIFIGSSKSWNMARLTTSWNPDGHIILRWWSDGPNYSESHIAETAQALEGKWISTGIVVDFSHANSKKDHKNQPMVCEDVAKQIRDWNAKIVWVMIEANIHEWKQRHTPWTDDPKDIQAGISITDSCVSLETNKDMLAQLNSAVENRSNI